MLHFTDMAAYADGEEIADHRARRGLPRLRRRGPPLHRRPLRPLLRQPRPLPRRGDRRRRQRADAQAALHQQLDRRPPAGDRARRAPRRARPAGARPRLLHLGRLGGGRVGLEAGGPVAPGQRRTGAAQGDRPPRRLPRGDDGGALDDRDRGMPRPRSSRSAIPTVHVANTNRYRHPQGDDDGRLREALLAEVEAAIAAEGRGDGRDADRRAGPERRRLPGPARRLLGRAARDLRPPRHPALLRRGDLRLRPASATGSAPSASATSRTCSPSPRA